MANWDLIDSFQLTSNVTEFSFTSINQTYTHLCLIFTCRANATGTAGGIEVKMNGSNMSAARYIEGNGNGSTGASGSQFDYNGGSLTGPSTTAGIYGTNIWWIPFYRGSNNNKVWLAQGVSPSRVSGGSQAYVEYVVNDTNSTSAISTIRVIPLSPMSIFLSGSNALLYGLI